MEHRKLVHMATIMVNKCIIYTGQI